jgi:hypothetical protein
MSWDIYMESINDLVGLEINQSVDDARGNKEGVRHNPRVP